MRRNFRSRRWKIDSGRAAGTGSRDGRGELLRLERLDRGARPRSPTPRRSRSGSVTGCSGVPSDSSRANSSQYLSSLGPFAELNGLIALALRRACGFAPDRSTRAARCRGSCRCASGSLADGRTCASTRRARRAPSIRRSSDARRSGCRRAPAAASRASAKSNVFWYWRHDLVGARVLEGGDVVGVLLVGELRQPVDFGRWETSRLCTRSPPCRTRDRREA